MKAPIFLLLATLAATPLTAAATRDAVASPHATMRELGLVHRSPIQREEHEQRRSFVPKVADKVVGSGVQVESLVTKSTIPAPRILAGFAGSHDIGFSPSDAAGAVSAKYLLHASNASVLAQDRAGATLSNISLASFWHDPAYTDGALYDSRVLYDATADRWVLCTLYDVNFKKATLLIAVSDGGNPSLGWRRYRFIIDPSDFLEADFTRMAMTRDSIVITANIFLQGAESAEVFIIRKSDAYAAASPPSVKVAQSSTYDLVPVDGRDDALLYLVAQSGSADLSVFSYNGTALSYVGNAPAPVSDLIGGLDAQTGLQLGSTLKLENGFTFLSNAILRNGTVWVVTEPYRTSPFRSSILWWRIALGSPLRVDTGLIDDPTGATNYAYPSIAVNKLGAALIAYSVFNASIYPSVGYTYIDPFNSMSIPALLKTGDGPSHTSRWADFSTTVVDANDIDFWTMQTYAPVFIAANGFWATWWARIEMPLAARRRAAGR